MRGDSANSLPIEKEKKRPVNFYAKNKNKKMKNKKKLEGRTSVY